MESLIPRKASRQERIAQWVIPAALWVWTAFLAWRFFGWINRYAVNVMFDDQWDFWSPVFDQRSWWAIFNYQHVHRQGLGFVLTVLLARCTGWNGRAESFMIAGFVVGALLVCLALTRRLMGRWSAADLMLPVLFLSSLMVAACVQIPNLSHGVMPLFLLLLYALCLTANSLVLRYGLILVINFLMTYTGFGFFIGLLTPAMLVLDIVDAGRRGDKRHMKLASAAVLAAVGTLALFFHKFVPQTAVAGWTFPDPQWRLYPHFAAMMVANAAGADGTDLAAAVHVGWKNYAAVAVGWAGLLAGMTVWCLHLVRLVKDGADTTSRVIVVLLGYALLFLASCSIGRLVLGLGASQAMRYVPLVLPLWLGLYLHVRQLAPRPARGMGAGLGTGFSLSRGRHAWTWRWALAGRARRWRWRSGLGTRARGLAIGWRAVAVAVFAVTLFFLNVKVRGAARRENENLTACKKAWVKAYLATGSVAEATRMTGGAMMHPRQEQALTPARLEFMRKNNLNLFQDADPATCFWRDENQAPATRK